MLAKYIFALVYIYISWSVQQKSNVYVSWSTYLDFEDFVLQHNIIHVLSESIIEICRFQCSISNYFMYSCIRAHNTFSNIKQVKMFYFSRRLYIYACVSNNINVVRLYHTHRSYYSIFKWRQLSHKNYSSCI